jgi:hypothetical protein
MRKAICLLFATIAVGGMALPRALACEQAGGLNQHRTARQWPHERAVPVIGQGLKGAPFIGYTYGTLPDHPLPATALAQLAIEGGAQEPAASSQPNVTNRHRTIVGRVTDAAAAAMVAKDRCLVPEARFERVGDYWQAPVLDRGKRAMAYIFDDGQVWLRTRLFVTLKAVEGPDGILRTQQIS